MAQTTKSHLYRLLCAALIDLRAEGHNAQNHLVFLLADLFHNVPLQLDRVDRGGLASGGILSWLHSRTCGTPMKSWLHLREQEVMQGKQDAQEPRSDDTKST